MNGNFERKYAVVGMGGIFPDAANIQEFWNNIVRGRVSIKLLSDKQLDREVFYRPEMYGKVDKHDTSYTQVGGVIDAFTFDGTKFRIPPAIARHMDENQKIALLAVQQAFANTSLERLDKQKIAVLMGVSGYGDLHHDFHKRFCFAQFAHYLEKDGVLHQKLNQDEKHQVMARLKERCIGHTFGTTEDSAPGNLPSIVASRIASVFDLHGRVYAVDAACASGLAAIVQGIQALDNGEADAVICGAVDMPMRGDREIISDVTHHSPPAPSLLKERGES